MNPLRSLFEAARNALCNRDWIVVEDAWGDINACRRNVELSEGDKVLRWDLRKGQAGRIARQLRRRRENAAEPVWSWWPREDVQ